MSAREAWRLEDESARLEALRQYGILDTVPEPAFDDLARLAAQLIGTPVALISLVDEHRVWHKARVGIDVTETPRAEAFCSTAIFQSTEPTLMIVPDACRDPRFANNPLVKNDPHIRFYAGATLVSPQRHVLGTLCVIDHQPRALRPEQEQGLLMLARQVVGQLELRQALRRQSALMQEREQAHAALVKTREHLAAVIEAEPECVSIIRADGTLLDMNPAGLEMFEIDRLERVLGASVFSVVAPEFRDAFIAFHRRVCAGERGRMTFDVVGLRGTRRTIETHAAPLHHGPSGTLAHLAISRDVTTMKRGRELELHEMAERRAAEEALRRSNERYQAVLRATQDVVWDWDWTRGVMTWSERLEAMLGHAPSSRHAEPAWKEAQLHPADRERVGQSLHAALGRRADSWSEEYQFRRGDGSYAHVLDRAALSYDAEGLPTRLVGAISDLTEQRELQAQLSLAERMATVGTLAAGVAHEINNPLSYVIGNLKYALESLEAHPLAQDAEGQEVRHALQEAEEGAQRVRVIVRELKTFSRGDEESVGPLDVHKPLESALMMAANEINHNARLVRDYARLPQVLANEARLAQVFLNLLVNAVQAMPSDTTHRNELRVVTRARGSGQVVVEISDTGAGIPPHLRARIFEPFFTTKPIGEGTGLGLSVCHRIITQLRGAIEVDSEPGQGSTFRILLPVAEAHARAG